MIVPATSNRSPPGTAMSESATGLPHTHGGDPQVRDGEHVLTILISDLEGSTALWERHDRAMEAVIQTHNRVLATEVEAHHGWVSQFRGDGVMAIFPLADRAIAAAIAMQRAVGRLRFDDVGALKIRIGLATGRCRLHEGELYGRAPNLAARLEAAGHGGQIVMDDRTAEAGEPDLPDDVSLFALGRYRMRGFPTPMLLHGVVAPALRDVFPPLRTAPQGLDDLPDDGGELYGRVELVNEIKGLVCEAPLVTLTGPAGVGKTRVAVRASSSVRRPFRQGVRFVDLAQTDTDAEVAAAVCAAVGASTNVDDHDSLATLQRALRGARLLLVLDSCEHVAEGVRETIASLAPVAPGVHVLATSRWPLDLAAETAIAVPPLSVPAPRSTTKEVVTSAAVQLFVDRVHRVDPSFTVDDHNVADVASVCRALAGIPLALELIAARVDIEPLSQLAHDPHMLVADLLAHRAGGRRDGLAESLAWTYERLDGSTARVLRSLTVFGGSFSADMVRDLHRQSEGPGADARVADSFSTIVHTSLAVPDQLDVGRFRLLETTRQHLRAIQRAEEVRALDDAHAALMLERARSWGPKIRTREADHAVAVLRADAVDLQQAVTHLVAANRIDDAAALVTSVFQFAMFDLEPALMASAVRIADRASERTVHASEVFGAAATASWFVGDFDRAIAFGERALVTAAQVGGSTIWARTALVDAHGYAGHLDELTRHFPLLVKELGSSDDPFWNVNGLGFQAISQSMFGRGDRARSHADRAMAIARQLGNPYCTYWALYALARAVESDDPITAIESLDLAMTVARQVGGRWNITLALVEWLALRRRVGRLDDVDSLVLDLLDLVSRSGNRSELADTLREAAHHLSDRGQDELAAIAMLARQNLPRMPGGANDEAGDERLLSTLHARLRDQWPRLELRASSVPEHELIELCREALSASSPT